MPHRPLLLLTVAAGLAFGALACTETVPLCEAMPTDPRCTGPDAGGHDAGGDDGGADGAVDGDAGPCGGACAAPTPLCREADGTCVACLTDRDCTDLAAARCDTAAGACAPCDDSAQCAGRTGTEVCAGAGAGAAAGSCVECTGDDPSACGANVCDSRMSTCTTTPAGTTGLCQPCVSDAQCRPGQLCIPMTFGTPEVEVGLYCLWRQDATESGAPMGDCFAARPYVDAAALTSVDGATATVCSLAVSTCEAHNDYRTTACTLPGTPADDECGVPGQPDGYCVMAGAATNRCTVPCGGDDDCQTGFTCDTTVTPTVCSL